MVAPVRTNKPQAVELGPIVVAVDGGCASRRALRWATKRSEQLGCELRIVTAFSPPVVPSESGMAVARSYAHAETQARYRARAVIESVLPGRRVEHIVRLGDAASVLDELSQDAHMIVVGTRRRERIWHRWRPSLTNRLTGMVSCPVVSVVSSEPERL